MSADRIEAAIRKLRTQSGWWNGDAVARKVLAELLAPETAPLSRAESSVVEIQQDATTEADKRPLTATEIIELNIAGYAKIKAECDADLERALRSGQVFGQFLDKLTAK